MDFVAALKEKAKKAGKTIVLCEGEDKRVVEAAAKIVKEKGRKELQKSSLSEQRKNAAELRRALTFPV